MFTKIDLEYYELDKKNTNYIYVDVRTPDEWADGNIPGSINIPIFTNEERAEIGYIYKQVNHKLARDRGIEIVAPKLPTLIKEIEELTHEGKVIVYCWRGGSRSKSISYLLNILNIPVNRLVGGYKSYRKYVMNYLDKYDFNKKYLVLNGMTGVGKTIILNKLQEDSYPVLDLEGFAGHRGSIFGQLNLKTINKQKQFDALLYERLEEIGHTDYFIIEAESKRLGQAIVPTGIMEGKEAGKHIIIEADIQVRQDRILAEYLRDSNKEDILVSIEEPLNYLKKNLDGGVAAQIKEAIGEKNIEEVIRLLMLDHYDKKYNHTIKNYQEKAYRVSANDIDEAIREIKILVEEVNNEYFN